MGKLEQFWLILTRNTLVFPNLLFEKEYFKHDIDYFILIEHPIYFGFRKMRVVGEAGAHVRLKSERTLFDPETTHHSNV